MLEELVPDPLLENEKLAYLWINIVKFYTLFFLNPKLRAIEIY